jgi:hypothetical protein
MPKYDLLFTVHGWVRSIIEADSEEAAREMIDEGEWEPIDDHTQYELETIEQAKEEE